ncbi:MAG: hypothetical protein LBL90_11205 [Prevotellaceae bacterium]|jgi:hypothetical protein|nr:hypothetical protein [Prevotellaceae bacterium]
MKKITYFIITLIAVLLIATTARAQKLSDKIFYGGGVGFSIESNYWMLNVSPILGYRFTPSFSGGVSFMYAYESYKKRHPDFTVNSYGGGAFLRYDLGPTLMENAPFSIFFQTDYEGRQEEVKYKKSEFYNVNDYSEFQNCLYLGAGYYQPLGGRIRAYLMVSIDVLHLGGDDDIKPLIRAGIEF